MGGVGGGGVGSGSGGSASGDSRGGDGTGRDMVMLTRVVIVVIVGVVVRWLVACTSSISLLQSHFLFFLLSFLNTTNDSKSKYSPNPQYFLL